jgi:hypothetical protein
VLNRRTLARLALLAWAGALAWLARRELGKNEQQIITESTVRLNPGANFFAVKASGRQIGYASETVDTVAAGFRLSEVMALDIPEADSTRRVTRRTELVLSRSLRLREFSRTLSGGGLFEELSGVVTDSTIAFRERDGRDRPAIEWTIPITGDVVLPEVLPYRLAFGRRLGVGRSVTANVLDLAMGTVGPVEFKAVAETTFVVADSAVEQRLTRRWMPVRFDSITAYRIEHQSGGTPMVMWVDNNGGLVQSEAALGVRLERGAFELVSFNYRDALTRHGPGAHRTVPAMATLVQSGQRPEPSDSTTFAVDSAPVERFLLPRLAWLEGGRQAVGGGTVRVGDRPGSVDRPKSEYLDPASAGRPDSVVVRVAREAVGSETDGAAIGRRLTTWVARRIAIDTANDAPFLPGTVLGAKRAGAEGHAALLAALARAAGIPARTVGGITVKSAHTYGHTWTELWVDGGWVAADPTFGQFPASARLLRIAIGGTGRPVDLVPLLGSATFAINSPATTR